MLEKLILEFIQRKPRSLNDLVSILKCGREEIKPILKDLMENDKISLSQGKYQSN